MAPRPPTDKAVSPASAGPQAHRQGGGRLRAPFGPAVRQRTPRGWKAFAISALRRAGSAAAFSTLLGPQICFLFILLTRPLVCCFAFSPRDFPWTPASPIRLWENPDLRCLDPARGPFPILRSETSAVPHISGCPCVPVRSSGPRPLRKGAGLRSSVFSLPNELSSVQPLAALRTISASSLGPGSTQ